MTNFDIFDKVVKDSTCLFNTVRCQYLTVLFLQITEKRLAPFCEFIVGMKHYSDVIMDAMASQNTSLTIIYSTVYSQIKENTKAPRHWPLWGTKGQYNAENVSIWWRHHVLAFLLLYFCSISYQIRPQYIESP